MRQPNTGKLECCIDLTGNNGQITSISRIFKRLADPCNKVCHDQEKYYTSISTHMLSKTNIQIHVYFTTSVYPLIQTKRYVSVNNRSKSIF
jgi:hypothetical protein